MKRNPKRELCPVCSIPITRSKTGKIRKHRNGNEGLQWTGTFPNHYRDYPTCRASGTDHPPKGE